MLQKNYQLNTDSKYFSLHILFFDFVLYLFAEVVITVSFPSLHKDHHETFQKIQHVGTM